MKLSRLLPQDTRMAELASGWALLLSAGAMFFGYSFPKELLILHELRFWIVVYAMIGFLQIWSIIDDGTEALRCVISWVAGSFWVWVIFKHGRWDPDDFAAMTIAFGNFYAFILNASLLRRDYNEIIEKKNKKFLK